jgi:hypothetical protein
MIVIDVNAWARVANRSASLSDFCTADLLLDGLFSFLPYAHSVNHFSLSSGAFSI